ncbi:MAG TPA: extracellular solute-binding protein [Deltaproteobacteria bacterium]|nr:extracellular solute-binding protein [Deltaproteobacteria bacterium]
MKKTFPCIFLIMIILVLVFSLVFTRGKPGSHISGTVEKWAEIFDPCVLSYEERLLELQWFNAAAQNLQGITVTSMAENIETHYYESRVLARAFEDITGIRVIQTIVPEGDLVPKITAQIDQDIGYFDIYVNDADLIGYHLRTKAVVNLTEYMQGEGAPYTNPYLDLDDFLNLEFGQDYDGNLLQLPDQQFANLYWFRHDWFSRSDIKKLFQEKYGYELGVPVNWAAYEDIAQFFTETRIDGKKVYGHFDYGKPSPSLGWRFTDAWFSIAGVGDKGLPNGLPVDEWGIRVRNRIPVGSSVTRGGAANGPAAVYALTKYIEWMKNYAPPEAMQWEWHDAGPLCARGDIAQHIFQYITWLSDPQFHTPGSPVCDKFGKPLWRVAPTPHGRYWDEGMKVGYQDAGSWTIPINTTGDQRAAAWLWAQFCVSKTVDLKKFIVGGTPIRKSTIFSDHLTKNISDYGGIIEFYRSSDQIKWTGSGRNVPHYPRMSEVWWKNIAQAITGDITPQEALDMVALQQDEIMRSLSMAVYSPVLDPEMTHEDHFSDHPTLSPKSPRDKPAPVTMDYEVLLKKWKQSISNSGR